MADWTNNADWDKPIEREVCGRVSFQFEPCEQPLPCPIHDRSHPVHTPDGKDEAALRTTQRPRTLIGEEGFEEPSSPPPEL